MIKYIASLMLTGLLLCMPDVILEVEPKEPISNRILFVVDRSGSMDNGHFGRALAAIRTTMEASTDDFQIGMIAFNDAAIRWDGIPETGQNQVPAGWAALPSEETIRQANGWLASLGASGNTLIIPALRDALRDRRESLSIVIVSDGLFGSERAADIIAMIETEQAARERARVGKAKIFVYGLGPLQQILTDIVNTGTGAYLREEAAPAGQ